MSYYFYVSVMAAIWCIAVLVKVVETRGRSASYQFSWWDGGTMFSGKELGASGSWLFAMFSMALLALSVYGAASFYSVAQ